MSVAVFEPYSLIFDRDGQPLENGYLWFGTAAQNPQTNPIVVYWDQAGTQIAAQPIRTSGGYPVRNGAPARVYVNADDYSLVIRDKNQRLISSQLNAAVFGSAFVGFMQAGTGAVTRTAEAKMRETASAADFGAVSDGVTDDTTAVGRMTATGKPLVNAVKLAYQYGTIAGGYGNVNAQDYATIGSSEMVTNGTFASAAAGWTLSNFTAAAGITHTAGTVGTATRSVTLKPFRQYLLTVVMNTTTRGSVDFQFNGVTMLDDSGYYICEVASNTYQFNFLNGSSTTTANIGIVTDTAFAGSITSISLIEVAQEMPLTYNNVSSDDLTMRIPQGLKFGRYNAGVLGFGDRQTLAFTQSAATWNVAFGARALSTNQAGIENTAFGSFALKYTTTDRNVAIGYSALKYNTLGYNNTALGYKALTNNTIGIRNSAGGFHSLFQNTGGNDNTGFGYQALYSLLNTNFNTSFGSQSAMNCRGTSNAFFGALAGYLNSNVNLTYTYNYGAMFGAESKVWGNYGTALGYLAQVGTDPNTAGTAVDYSVAVGATATVTSGEATALGYGAVASTGARNIAIGKGSLASGNSGGDGQCTVVGFNARGTGYASTTVGSQAGTNQNGGYNTFVGYLAGNQGAAQTWQNVTCIGASANATASNQVTLGDTNVTALRCAVTTITALSDQRDKDQIAPLDVPDAFLDEVLVASWVWDQRDLDGRGVSSRNGSRDFGVIAQQIKALQQKHGVEWLGLVDESNPDRLEATPGKLLFPLIQKVQRQSALIASMEARLAALENKQ